MSPILSIYALTFLDETSNIICFSPIQNTVLLYTISAVITPSLGTLSIVFTPASLPTVFNFISFPAEITPPLHTDFSCRNSIFFKAVISELY